MVDPFAGFWTSVESSHGEADRDNGKHDDSSTRMRLVSCIA
jgi:hypothetical protein